MPAVPSSYGQASFLSGEWAPYTHGRYDLPLYKQALTVNLNAVILEGGTWSRRSGTEIMGPTYGRTAAKLLPFQSNAANPFLLEFTNNALRLWYGTGPVCTNDRQVLTDSSSSSGVISVTTTSNHGWSVGDQFVLWCPTSLSLAASDMAVVQNRQLQALTASTDVLTLADDLGNDLPSDISSGGLNGATLIRILRQTTTIATASLPYTQIIQVQTQGVILSPGAAPQVLKVTTDLSLATSDSDAVFSYAAATFVDGPYLAPQPDAGTVSAYTGTITFTPASSTFQASDVGRHIRLWSQPPNWAVGTTYAANDLVTYQGAFWQSTQGSNVGNYPGNPVIVSGVLQQFWSAAPNAGVWAWGTIATQATTSCTVTLSNASGTGGAAGALPSANGSTITQWMLGAYTGGNYPTCGTYDGGRLWLFGAVLNEVDASVSNQGLQFSPTDQYGNVNDNNAISVVLNFGELTTFVWAASVEQGILCGTNGGEILLSSATSLGSPITPSNFQANRVTKYRAANVPVRSVGLSTVFVQLYGQRIMEYVQTFSFTGAGFSARHLNEYAKHLMQAGVKEIYYQEEKAPIVWALMNDGTLAGCTYRRVSKFVTDPPTVEAWHRHTIGDIMGVNSMTVLPGVNGLGDILYLNTEDANEQFWVEAMRPIFEDA